MADLDKSKAKKSKLSEETKKKLEKISGNVIDVVTKEASKEEPKQESTQSLFEYDELKMYFGEPYWVTDKIEVLQPSLGDIIEYGDTEFYSVVSTLCTNTKSLRLQLWENGIDWTKMSDYELFMQLIRNYTPKETYLIFGDLNLSWFKPFLKKDKETGTEQIILVNIPRDEEGNEIPVKLEDAIIIDEFVYIRIVDYLRHMFDIHPKEERNIKGKVAKEWIMDEERMKIANEKRLNKGKVKRKSFLYPLISSMVNHPGFKYKKNELKEVGIVEFMDSVKRLQTYESVTALMSGMYSGMIDTKKLNLKEELNWMRDLYN